METTLTITREEIQANNPITVLHLQGWLDAKGEENLLAAARAAYSEGARFMILDLAGVETLTSAGMRAMHKVYKLYTPTEERMKRLRVSICNAPVQVNNILGITGFLLNIPSYRNMQLAIDSFK
ncbi:MAG: STAS domain-containing protein [Anaerolineales bacterium]|jgi:anti-anti-sigma factor|uniref:STAS domain-containing protein n=1 Tax=Candidatus Villigracilis affinis TaxID=3140682 RepID=UPI001D92B173|nr:STAS domain-containing protein [Anaerolineales bacterium]MBK9604063.1 STAS domain-containing protein [Anaerolineales bacterium]